MCNKSTGHESQIGTESGFDWREGEEEAEEEEEAILQKRRERSLSQRDQDAAKAMRRITRVPETIKRNFKSLILNT